MIHYLDQESSIGPNSLRAKKGGKVTGLNENLAREVLELHTLCVDGPYDQHNVRELAELLTGVTNGLPLQLKFRKGYAEPGAETVLGQTYGGGQPHIPDVEAVLRDLADITHWVSVIKITTSAAEDPTTPQEERERGLAMAQALPMRVLSRMWQMLLKDLEEVAFAPNAMMAAEM